MIKNTKNKSEKFKLQKNKKYLFATDLDGTFLTSYRDSMHVDNYQAVKMIKQHHFPFVIATGRSWWWAKKIYDQLGLVDASIHFSGAQIHNVNNNAFKVNFNHKFIEIYTYIKKEEIIELVKENDLITKVDFFSVVGKEHQAEFSEMEDIDKLFFDAFEFVCVIKNNPRYANKLFLDLKKKYQKRFVIKYWEHQKMREIVFSPPETDKAIALKYVLKQYNMTEDNLIYFGDNINDIEALKLAKMSYVPKNGNKKALEVAKEVLDNTNDQGAVAKKIIQLINDLDNEK
ncbi:MAG: hydrolase [Candidatus Hepatoplasma scabrum]|nr:MAG: hydrolase [Candidatus Hepatoplasma sp.]